MGLKGTRLSRCRRAGAIEARGDRLGHYRGSGIGGAVRSRAEPLLGMWRSRQSSYRVAGINGAAEPG